MEITVDGTRVYTEGMAEFNHPELAADAGERDLVAGAISVVERLAEVVSGGIKRFRHGERLSFQAAFIELHEVDGVLEMWEPDGEQWRPGIRRGLELLEQIDLLEQDHAIDEGGIELNLVCSVSPRVGVSRRVTMRRREVFSNHSGWEIIAAEDEGNPACLTHPPIASLWKRETRLLPYVCLPVGAEVRIEGNQIDVGYPKEASKPVWEEPDEVWAHHDPANAEGADWMVTGRLNPQRPGVPMWEWVPLRRTGADTGVLCAVPFLLHGLALGDEVRVNRHGVIDRRIRESGRAALRVEFVEREDNPVIDELRRRGINCEWMNDAVLAIDCDSGRHASELMTWLEERDECSIVSHSLAYQSRSLTGAVNDGFIRTALLVGGGLGMFGGLWAEGTRSERLEIAVLLTAINALMLWVITANRWIITVFDSQYPRWYAVRVIAGTWACFSAAFAAILLLVFEASLWYSFGVGGLVGGLASVSLSQHHRSPTLLRATDAEIPPPFYRYARANFDGGRVELLVAGDGTTQAIITRENFESRSYPSFYDAASALSDEFGIGRGSWWYGR